MVEVAGNAVGPTGRTGDEVVRMPSAIGLDRDGPLRLVHTTTVPETLGFLTCQVGHLLGKGLEVHALSSAGEQLEQFGRRMRIPTHAVSMARRITPLADLQALRRIRQLFRRLRPDI